MNGGGWAGECILTGKEKENSAAASGYVMGDMEELEKWNEIGDMEAPERSATASCAWPAFHLPKAVLAELVMAVQKVPIPCLDLRGDARRQWGLVSPGMALREGHGYPHTSA